MILCDFEITITFYFYKFCYSFVSVVFPVVSLVEDTITFVMSQFSQTSRRYLVLINCSFSLCLVKICVTLIILCKQITNIYDGAFLRFLAVNCFRKGVPSQMFDWIPNIPLNWLLQLANQG